MTSSDETTSVTVLKGAAGVLAVRAIAAVISYLMFFAVARLASTHEFGLFGFGLSLASVCSLLVAAGQPTAILRLWPQLLVSDNQPAAESTLAAGLITVSAAGVAFTLAVWATNALLPVGPYSAYRDIVHPVLALASLLAISQFLSSSLRARERPWLALIPREIGWRACVTFGVWLGSVAIGFAWVGSALIWFMCACLLMMLVPQAISIIGPLSRGFKALAVSLDVTAWRTLSNSLWQITWLEAFTVEAGVLLIAVLAAPEAVGSYFLADRIAGFLGFTVLAANVYVAPILSRLHFGDDQKALQDVCRTASIIAFFPSLAGFLVLALFGADFLGLFGRDYESASPVLLTLAAGQLLNAAFGPAGSLMQMTGHELGLRKLLWLNALGVMIIAPLLYMVWGPAGLAAGIVFPRLLKNLGACISIRKHLQIDPSVLSVLRWSAGR